MGTRKPAATTTPAKATTKPAAKKPAAPRKPKEEATHDDAGNVLKRTRIL